MVCSIGPRPASQPAQSSAMHAVPGTYQVQSANECTPNTTTIVNMLSIPIRSGVYGRPARLHRHPRQRRLKGWVARPAATSQEKSRASVTASPASPSSASVCTM